MSNDSPFVLRADGKLGYDPDEVDTFFAEARKQYTRDGNGPDTITSREVRSAVFSSRKNGYDPESVDIVLDRLEDVLIRRERDALISSRGEETWLADIGRLSVVLRSRLSRPRGERFREPSKDSAQSYDKEDVDALADELLLFFDQDEPMGIEIVRCATFRAVRGKDGYEEAQVDAFLDRVVELMVSLDLDLE